MILILIHFMRYDEKVKIKVKVKVMIKCTFVTNGQEGGSFVNLFTSPASCETTKFLCTLLVNSPKITYV